MSNTVVVDTSIVIKSLFRNRWRRVINGFLTKRQATYNFWERLGEKRKASSPEKILGRDVYEGENTIFGTSKERSSRGKTLGVQQ
jgi:hypothetical protein